MHGAVVAAVVAAVSDKRACTARCHERQPLARNRTAKAATASEFYAYHFW